MWLNVFVMGFSAGILVSMALLEYLKRDAKTFFAKMREDYWEWHGLQIAALRVRLDYERGVFRQQVRIEQDRIPPPTTWVSRN